MTKNKESKEEFNLNEIFKELAQNLKGRSKYAKNNSEKIDWIFKEKSD